MSRGEIHLTAAARGVVYRLLAAAFRVPDAETTTWLQAEMPATEAALAILGDRASLAALAAVDAALAPAGAADLAAAHRRIFGHIVSGDCPPYEAEYGQRHIFQKTQTLADNAGFFRAFGLAQPEGAGERGDHVSVELEFMHFLAVKEAYARLRRHARGQLRLLRTAQARYLREHLGRWTPAFAARLEAAAGGGFYAGLARLLAAFVARDARSLGAPSPALAEIALSPREDLPADCERCLADSLLTADERSGA